MKKLVLSFTVLVFICSQVNHLIILLFSQYLMPLLSVLLIQDKNVLVDQPSMH